MFNSLKHKRFRQTKCYLNSSVVTTDERFAPDRG